jgi:hypothetical protein
MKKLYENIQRAVCQISQKWRQGGQKAKKHINGIEVIKSQIMQIHTCGKV